MYVPIFFSGIKMDKNPWAVDSIKDFWFLNCPECDFKVWQYGLWSFPTGDTKLETFLPKNQHTQR